MDVTLPSISGASPVNVATNNRRPIFRATVTDKGSGIDPASIALEVPIGTTITPHVSPIAGGYTIVYTPTADLAPAQPLTWRLSAVDGAGNQQGKQFSFKLDTTLPVISGASPVNVATNNRRPIFRATITDPGTGINPATIIIKMPTGTLVRPSLTVVPDGYTLAYTPTADLVQATPFRWDVSARDIAGNRMVSKFSFYLDTTLPAISGASPVNIATNNRRPTFQATLIDLGAQIDPASIRLEIPVGRRVTPVRTAITNGYAIQWTPPVSLAPNSAYPWKITVRDRAGNERSQQFTFNLDVALPVISAVSPVNVTTANRRPVFKATVTDVGSGINPARVAIEVPLGTAVRPILTPVAGGYTIEYTPSVDLSPASPFVWRITVWDRAGNGISKQFSFTLVP
jgi:hypothetical protein